MMITEILLSGFGGQGLLRLGKILAWAALKESKYTVWFPSYGGEMRGGTAHCFVKISDKPINSPLVEKSDIAIILNQPSLDKFEKTLKTKGLLVLNSDLVQRAPFRRDIRKGIYPLNRIARECGTIKVANTVALGALIALQSSLLGPETIMVVLKEMFGHNKKIFEQNLEAFYRGQKLVHG
ncbi:MAG: 2-oxoacid:acceptor oxidoreductase family protein [Candidatus Omnitrophota bacterium]|nr:MAG: 2-oxoacid:acceptor oxidoreductase family protein [Candidatus Omnitrophota bacterium]